MQPIPTCNDDRAGGHSPARLVVELDEKIVALQRANIRENIKDMEEFRPEIRHRPALHVIAGGHSVKYTLGKAKGDICAINGAHDWLIDRGIIPTYALLLDWSDEVAKRISPHRDVIYLVCSQCSPALFDKLKGYDVRVWHTGTADGIVPGGTRTYGGGPNATQRVIPVLYDYGYRDFHFHGVDACFSGGKTHTYDWPGLGNSTFLTRLDWLNQAQSFEDFLEIYDEWQNNGSMSRISIKVHGDGLIPHIARVKGCHANTVD